MKRKLNFKHLLSLLIILLFSWLAYSSDNDSGSNYDNSDNSGNSSNYDYNSTENQNTSEQYETHENVEVEYEGDVNIEDEVEYIPDYNLDNNTLNKLQELCDNSNYIKNNGKLKRFKIARYLNKNGYRKSNGDRFRIKDIPRYKP